ncbi:MAG TPA: hypothetical protein VFT38_14875 [Vicinamibacteria bacterium]|nr:hypothetical protein [Vicinamibacteria bacterium]
MNRTLLRQRRRFAVVGVVLALAGCDAYYDAARAAIGAERAAAGAPLPATASNAVAEKDTALENAWFERNFLQAYRRVGRHNAKWDAAVESFLRESAPSLMRIPPDATRDAQGRAKTILDAGCDDPMMLYFAARTWLLQGGPSRETSELFERAVAGMHDTPYPRAVARLAASGLRADYERRAEGTGKRAALDPIELRWFKESLTDGSYAPDEDVVLADHLLVGTGNELFERNDAAVDAAVQSAPWTDPWLRLVITGERNIEEAWNSRGTQYGDKVKGEEWKGMEESLAAARKALTESWKLRPDRPEAATAMINVAMAGGARGETPRLWFDRAVGARFDYMLAYDALKDALRARWSGDPGALLAFARECAATRRFDTAVPLEAFWAVEQMEWDAADEARGGGRIEDPEEARRVAEAAVLPASAYKSPDVYELISTVLERYRRNPGNDGWRRYASYQAYVNYKAERYEDARKELDNLSGQLEPDAREWVGGTLPEARIYALASPLGSEVKHVEELYRAGKLGEAVPLLAKARAGAPPQAQPYFDQRLAAGRIEADLAAGRVATLFPTKTLAGWTPQQGTWRVESDGSLVATSDAHGHLIAADAHAGSNLEVAADIEIVSTSNGQFQAGVILGRDISMESQDWLSFRVKNTAHEGRVVYFSRHFYKPAQVVPYTVGLKCRVVVQSWGGHLWAYVDGKPMVSDYVPEWQMTPGSYTQFGFGGYLDDNTTVVRYSNIRVRRLTAAPTPPREGAAAGKPAGR